MDAGLYRQAAIQEFYSTNRNYCRANEGCYARASQMINTLASLTAKSCPSTRLQGPTGKWGDKSLVKKVVVRYPEEDAHGEFTKWKYHVATLVNVCGVGWRAIDPIGPPDLNPTTMQTDREWCVTWSKGLESQWGDAEYLPADGRTTCEVIPADQSGFEKQSGNPAAVYTEPGYPGFPKRDPPVDPLDPSVSSRYEQCLKRSVDRSLPTCQPFPVGADADSDSDGVPDDYDNCPGTKKETSPCAMSANELGCSKAQLDKRR